MRSSVVALGDHGTVYATRSQARRIVASAFRGQDGGSNEMVLDLERVALASPSFLDEFIGAMAGAWPGAGLVVTGQEPLVSKTVALAKRRGLRTRASPSAAP